VKSSSYKSIRLLTICILGAIALSAAQTIQIPETGSSLLYPLFNLWVPAYTQSNPDVKITTASTGSGNGISQAVEGIAQIGASDAYMSDGMMKQHANMLNIALAISSQMINYNLPGPNEQRLKLSGPVLAAIYQGKITHWNEGNFVLPDDKSVQAATNAMVPQTPQNERMSLIFAPGADSYPIINYEITAHGQQILPGAHFGILFLTAGTLLSTVISLLIAIPLGVGSAIFLSEAMPASPRTWVLVMVFVRGASSFSWTILTHVTEGVDGGLLNAIEGTAVLAFGGILLAIPPGVGGGIYLAEFDTGTFASSIRFLADVLVGVPSIVIGYFSMSRWSSTSGGNFQSLPERSRSGSFLCPTSAAPRKWRCARCPADFVRAPTRSAQATRTSS
jgi:hypothetical protein